MNALNILSYQDSFLVTNADTWISGGFEEISNSAPNTICALEMEDSNRYGTLHLDAGRVTKFLEKEESAVNEASFINAGLCHLAPEIFKHFKENTNFSLEKEIFPNLASSGLLFAKTINSYFIDIGIPEDYYKFCKWIEGGKTGAI